MGPASGDEGEEEEEDEEEGLLEEEEEEEEDVMVNENAVALLQEMLGLSRTHVIELLAQFGGSVDNVIGQLYD